jgi:hypothetical protein
MSAQREEHDCEKDLPHTILRLIGLHVVGQFGRVRTRWYPKLRHALPDGNGLSGGDFLPEDRLAFDLIPLF